MVKIKIPITYEIRNAISEALKECVFSFNLDFNFNEITVEQKESDESLNPADKKIQTKNVKLNTP